MLLLLLSLLQAAITTLVAPGIQGPSTNRQQQQQPHQCTPPIQQLQQQQLLLLLLLARLLLAPQPAPPAAAATTISRLVVFYVNCRRLLQFGRLDSRRTRSCESSSCSGAARQQQAEQQQQHQQQQLQEQQQQVSQGPQQLQQQRTDQVESAAEASDFPLSAAAAAAALSSSRSHRASRERARTSASSSAAAAAAATVAAALVAAAAVVAAAERAGRAEGPKRQQQSQQPSSLIGSFSASRPNLQRLQQQQQQQQQQQRQLTMGAHCTKNATSRYTSAASPAACVAPRAAAAAVAEAADAATAGAAAPAAAPDNSEEPFNAFAAPQQLLLQQEQQQLPGQHLCMQPEGQQQLLLQSGASVLSDLGAPAAAAAAAEQRSGSPAFASGGSSNSHRGHKHEAEFPAAAAAPGRGGASRTKKDRGSIELGSSSAAQEQPQGAPFQWSASTVLDGDDAAVAAAATAATTAVHGTKGGAEGPHLLVDHLREAHSSSSSSGSRGYAEQLLLESSLVGPFLMLPWSENDPDILNNFYLEVPPPCSSSSSSSSSGACVDAAAAAAARHTQPVAVHSSVPPTSAAAAAAEPQQQQLLLLLGKHRRRGSQIERDALGLYVTDSCCGGSNYPAPADAAAATAAAGGAAAAPPHPVGWVGGRWADPEGLLTLSQKQQQKFYSWRRVGEALQQQQRQQQQQLVPEVLTGEPCSRSIRQGFVGDCSFLSSLAVLSDYERRHGLPVISGLIYPQKRRPVQQRSSSSSRPVYNPRGMYGVKLFFNGVARKVLVDDYVPVRRDGKLLCAHSSKAAELWVSLLEKAFVKLMGGSYSMQGSNPGADLYHLTGWIPETIPFRSDVHTGTPASHKPIVTGGESDLVLQQQRNNPAWDVVWFQLNRGLRDGRCVACLGTSEVFDAAPSGLEFPEGVSVSSGIVARHAYSVLRHAEVLGFRLLYVKNPWGCMRWRGRFSPSDKKTWTHELKMALNYDPAVAGKDDCGCFWIEWLDVVRWFSHLYVCWNAAYFPFISEVHSKWEKTRFVRESLLADDSHLVAFNPQLRLSVAAGSASRKALPPYVSFPSLTNGDILTLDLGGGCPRTAAAATAAGEGSLNASSPTRRSSSSEPDNDGSSSSSGKDPVELWILLSRHVRERQRDLSSKYLAVHIHEGLARVACPPPPAKQGVYSNGECTLVKIRLDPAVLFGAAAPAPSAAAELPAAAAASQQQQPMLLQQGGSKAEREAFAYNLQKALNYVLVVSQYSQKDEFNFTMKVFSHIPASLDPLPPLFEPNWNSVYLLGEWTRDNAGGCSNDLWSFFKNPHFRLILPDAIEAVFFLECPDEYSVNLRLFSGRIATPRLLRTGKAKTSGSYRAGCCMLSASLSPGEYTLICSTFKPDNLGTFQISLHYRNNNSSSTSSSSSRPVLTPIPYPYAVPPDRRLFLQSLRGPSAAALTAKHTWGRVAIQASVPTRVSLRLEILASKLPLPSAPSLTLYLFAPADSSSSSKKPKQLQLIKKSDLDGGLSEDGRTKSSAAQDLLQRQGVLNVTLADLTDTSHAYIAFIYSPFPENSADPEVGKEWGPIPWMLHVISDHKLQCTAL
ncbi:hypothetical protein Esti_001948 [Eimeria stiedai]